MGIAPLPSAIAKASEPHLRPIFFSDSILDQCSMGFRVYSTRRVCSCRGAGLQLTQWFFANDFVRSRCALGLEKQACLPGERRLACEVCS
jgi:hypothetical protein